METAGEKRGDIGYGAAIPRKRASGLLLEVAAQGEGQLVVLRGGDGAFCLDITIESFLAGHVRAFAWLGGVPRFTRCIDGRRRLRLAADIDGFCRTSIVRE